MYGDGLMQFSPFSDEHIAPVQRFPDGQQEVVLFSVAARRHFQEIRLRPRGARDKREKLEHESDADVVTKAPKSLQTSIEQSKRMVRKRCKAIRADRMLTLSTRRASVRSFGRGDRAIPHRFIGTRRWECSGWPQGPNSATAKRCGSGW